MMPEPLVTELDLIKARVTSLERELARLTALITPVPMTPTTPTGTQGTMTVAETPKIIGWVTPNTEYGANIRDWPSTQDYSPVLYRLKYGDSMGVTENTDMDAEKKMNPLTGMPYKWYMLEDENFVRSDVVTFSTEKPAARPTLIPAIPVTIPAMPVKWQPPVSGYTITNHHHNAIQHDGIDLACPLGTPVRCGPYGGVVTKSFTCYTCNTNGDGIASLTDKNKAYGYGSYVIVAYRYGQLPGPVQALMPIGAWLFAIHAHLSRVLVSQGETLTPNQVIGEVGSTGNSSGAHLHYALHWGDANSDFYAIRKNTIDPQLLVMV